jgi:putative two-component system response regulator
MGYRKSQTMTDNAIAPKILLVDDDERNLRLMEALLLPLKYDLRLARDGQEAVETVRENPPDVILLDIMMPKMDGFEVARILKSDNELRIIPIVMVTSLSEVKDRVKAMESGADDFLNKPVDKTELRARVNSLIKVKAYNDYMRNYQQKLEAEVAKRTDQLKTAFKKVKLASLETIYRLSKAAEYKDEETGSHIRRVSNYAAAIARRLGLAEKACESILLAAPMHDVGKIGIPDKILLKPGELSSDEWEIMKNHTLYGARILGGSQVGFIRLAEVIALTHHECWDGSGYPLGLKHKQIPMAGRIMAVADVFDALTSKRPYKEAFSVDNSFDTLKKGSGKHFDPQLIDIFFEIKDEILSIKNRYKGEGKSLMAKMALLEAEIRR